MRHILMIAYTSYVSDARIRREAETLASEPPNQVTLFAPKEGKKARSYEKGGVKVIESRLPKYQGASMINYMLSYMVFTVLAFGTCLARVIRGRINVVHVHNMPNFLIFAAWPVRMRGGKIVLDVHDTMPETYAAKFREGKGSLLLRCMELEESICTAIADAVIAVNEPQAEVLVSRGVPRDKITISMNVPDDTIFDYGQEINNNSADGAFHTVYHGTIAGRHGVDDAIRAVAAVKNRIPGIELHVLGYGDALEDCMRLVEDLDAGNYIHFPGMFNLEDMIVYLKKMDLEIVTNQRNAASELMLPVKLMECIALGLPVVTAKLRTIEYYFSDDMVYFFEPDNLDSLIETVLMAYRDNDERRLKAVNARRFLEVYGWNTHKHDLINLYENLYPR